MGTGGEKPELPEQVPCEIAVVIKRQLLTGGVLLEWFRASAPAGIAGDSMPNLNAPRRITFLISLALAIVAILGALVVIPFISQFAFWIAILAYVVLALGVIMRGL